MQLFTGTGNAQNISSMQYKPLLSLAAILLFGATARAQQGIAVNANGAAPDPSAILDVQSTSKGMLVPRMSATQRTGIPAPVAGLLVYDTDSNAFFFRTATAWTKIASGNLMAAPETDPQVSSSTTNKVPRWNGTTLTDGAIYDNGTNVGIGISNTTVPLQVAAPQGIIRLESSSDNATFLEEATPYAAWRIGQNKPTDNPTAADGFYIYGGTYNSPATRMYIKTNGNVGIGNTNPGQKLDVSGTTKTTNLQVTAGATTGYVLTSDAAGNATWQAASAATADNLGNHTATQTVKLNNNWLSNDGGAEGIRVDNSGNVGIGTATPAERLDVTGNIKSTDTVKTAKFRMTNGATAGYVLTSDATGNATWQSPAVATETDPQVSSTTTNKVPKWNGTTLTDGLIYDNGTNVGIGTTTPGAPLHVSAGTGQAIIQSTNDVSTFLRVGAPFSNWEIGTNRPADNPTTLDGFFIRDANLGPTRLYISPTANGYMGIGTVTPATRLDVAGTMKSTGLQMTTGAVAGHVLTSDAAGNATWQAPTGSGGAADNLGNHTATQNVKLNNNWLSNDGGAEGIRVDNAGNVGVGVAAPATPLEVGGNLRISSTGNGNLELNSGVQANIYPNGPNTPADANLQVRSKGNGALALNYDNPGYVSLVAGGGGVIIGTPTSMGDDLQVNGSTFLNGTVKVGTNGSVVKSIVHFGLGATGTTSVASEGTYEYTFSNISDVTTASSVVVNPAAPLTAGFVIAYSYVSAPGVVKVVIQNTKSSAQTLALSQFIFTITNY